LRRPRHRRGRRARELGLKLPIIVRMEGTNVEQGRQILLDSKLPFTIAAGMKDAPKKPCASREVRDERSGNEKTRLIVQGFTAAKEPFTASK